MKLRLVLWIPTATGKIYLLSLAAGKSKRQLNDWMNKRTRKKQVQKLSSNLTGKLSYFLLLRVMHQIHAWCDQLIPGDMVVFNCESAKPEKQFRAWGKWLTTKDSKCKWISNPKFLSFYFYKHMNLE